MYSFWTRFLLLQSQREFMKEVKMVQVTSLKKQFIKEIDLFF